MKDFIMDFKIDLGLNEKIERDTSIDVVAAAEAMSAAEMSLVKCETEKAVIVAAAENLERGVQLSQAIAEKTQDEGVALAVGNEALVASMRMLGQANAGESLTTGTESFSAGVEASEGMLKKMIEKAKEYAKKVWEFIRNLIAKIVKWVKGLVGKGEDTATVLSDLIKKAKDAKKTTLKSGAEFDKATKVRLGKNLRYLVKSKSGKVTSSEIATLNAATKTLLGNAVSDNMANLDSSKFTSTAIKSGDNASTADGKTIAKIKSDIDAALGDNVKTLLVVSTTGLTGLSGEAKTDVEDELGDHTSAYGVELFNDGDVVKYGVFVMDAEKEDLEKFNSTAADALKGVDAFKLAKKVLDKLKFKIITIAPEFSDIEDDVEELEPFTFTDCSGLVKTLKDNTKQAEKVAKQAEKATDKVVKDINKALDTLLKDANGAPDSKTAAYDANRALLNVYDATAREYHKEAALMVRAAVRPKWGDIVKESLRLMEK